MGSERLGEKIGISEELIKKSCQLSFLKAENLPDELLFHVDNSSTEAVFIVFTGSWSVTDWYSDQAFGDTKINTELFPCMRSLGNGDVAKVNRAFLERFELILEKKQLPDEVKRALDASKPIIFTGHSSAGAMAVLATIWFLENYSKPECSTAYCVTFGSPLVGDHILSHAFKREKWSKKFIHFVMRCDIVPRIMLAPLSSIQPEFEKILHFFNPKFRDFPCESVTLDFYTKVMSKTSSLASHAACKLMGNTNLLIETLTNFSQLSPYTPFGTYIFCIGNGKLVHLDNQEAVLQVLSHSCLLTDDTEKTVTATRCLKDHLSYQNETIGNANSLDNVQDLVCIERLAELPLTSDDGALDELGLNGEARLCLRAAGELENQKCKNKARLDSKMQEINIGLKVVQEYKDFYSDKLGYYDAFKKQEDNKDFHANKTRLVLAGILDEMIEMLKVYVLPDEFEGEPDWIKLCTKFRRLVEPLDIANYYRHARGEEAGEYMKKGRPRRYRYPQIWLEKRDGLKLGSCGDSCFLAEVEEMLKVANNGGNIDKAMAKKVQREVAAWINSEVVGKDVLLKESTFGRFWEELGRQKLQEESLRPLIELK